MGADKRVVFRRWKHSSLIIVVCELYDNTGALYVYEHACRYNVHGKRGWRQVFAGKLYKTYSTHIIYALYIFNFVNNIMNVSALMILFAVTLDPRA